MYSEFIIGFVSARSLLPFEDVWFILGADLGEHAVFVDPLVKVLL